MDTKYENITDEKFSILCLQNAAWKFLYYMLGAVSWIIIFFIFGIVSNITWGPVILWCVFFVSFMYFVDIILPNRNLFFTQDFYVWANAWSEVKNKEAEETLQYMVEEANKQGIEIEIEDDKIKRYGHRLEPVNTEKSNVAFKDLLDAIEDYEKSEGRERTVKALADVLAAYSEIIGATETTIDGETYKIEVERKKYEQNEK